MSDIASFMNGINFSKEQKGDGEDALLMRRSNMYGACGRGLSGQHLYASMKT